MAETHLGKQELYPLSVVIATSGWRDACENTISYLNSGETVYLLEILVCIPEE